MCDVHFLKWLFSRPSLLQILEYPGSARTPLRRRSMHPQQSRSVPHGLLAGTFNAMPVQDVLASIPNPKIICICRRVPKDDGLCSSK
jgi:hypothetical protein